MVQGTLKKSKSQSGRSSNSAGVKKAVAKAKMAKLGSVTLLPKKHFRDQAMEERQLSKVCHRLHSISNVGRLVDLSCFSS